MASLSRMHVSYFKNFVYTCIFYLRVLETLPFPLDSRDSFLYPRPPSHAEGFNPVLYPPCSSASSVFCVSHRGLSLEDELLGSGHTLTGSPLERDSDARIL